MSNVEVYKCDSINNKLVRSNELNILEKHEKELYFVFGENQKNTKKRIYNDLKTLNKDYAEVEKMKQRQEKQKESSKIFNKNIEKPSEDME